LISRKTARAYNALFKRQLEIEPQRTPQTIIIDFKRTAMVSSKAIFNNFTIRGCWFHSSQAQWRKVVEFSKLINIFDSSISIY